MKTFRLFLLAAILFGAFPAVSGACDGLFNRASDRLAERRAQSPFGFGVVKMRPVARTVVTVVAITKAIPAAVKRPAQAPPVCANGTCKIK